MGCGASRAGPVTPTLSFIPRIEKERDDESLELVQLKRLGVPVYDDFFNDFELIVNAVVKLNNEVHDALWDAKAALAYASSPDPEYALNLEVATDGVRSTPQLLLDVLYAESSSRPQPFEVRHLLTSRPAVAEADRAVAEAVQALTAALQSHPAPAHLSYDDGKKQLTVTPVSTGPSVPGAARQYQRLQQHTARVSSSLAAMRKAAPGLRLQVIVVPSPAPGARTFSWRLLPRPDAATEGDQGCQGMQTSAAAATATPAATAAGGATGAPCMATPLRVASAHGAAAIVEAAATVAQQAAAIAAAVTSAAAPLVQWQLEARRRLVAVTPSEAFVAAVAAAAAATPQRLKGSTVILRSLSLTRGEPSATGGGAAATAGGGAGKGIAAAARADEAAAVLRRAVNNANHALFRLSKYGTAGASSGRDAAALRKGDPSAYPLSRALTLVLEAAIRAARQASATAAAAAPAGGPSRGSDGDGGVGALSVSELVSVESQLRSASYSGSVLSSSVQGGGGGGAAAAASMASGGVNSNVPFSPVFSREGGGGDGFIPGWGWSWEWGIQPRVAGLAFPDCLPPKARAVYDAVNRAIDAAGAITEQLPLVQHEVAAAVEEADAVFANNDEQLAAAARDMMSAGRMRAALDRNANTISASPALVGRLRATVTRLLDELRRGAEQMREMAHGEPDGNADADGLERISPRASGSRSIMTRQLNKAAAVAAAAVAAAAAAAAAEDEDDESADGRSDGASGSGSLGGSSGGGGESGEDSVGDGGGGGARGGERAVRANGYGTDCGAGKRSSGTGSGGGGGAGAAGGARGGLKPATGTKAARGRAVSRRVVLPPLS